MAMDHAAPFLYIHIRRFGEDGAIQGILGILGIPYTGSGELASRLSMDKINSRKVLEIYGLSVPRYRVLDKFSYHPGRLGYHKLNFPLVVKPAACGSSIGLSIADNPAGFEQAVEEAFAFGEQIIAEEYIAGREVTVGILDDKPLPVIQVVPKRRYYDEVAKYTAGMTEYLCPAPITEDEAKLAQDAAVRAHSAIGCRSFSRVDMILSDRGKVPAGGRVVILEVNTIPGMTQLSLLPKAAKVADIDFPELCEKMLESAFK